MLDEALAQLQVSDPVDKCLKRLPLHPNLLDQKRQKLAKLGCDLRCFEVEQNDEQVVLTELLAILNNLPDELSDVVQHDFQFLVFALLADYLLEVDFFVALAHWQLPPPIHHLGEGLDYLVVADGELLGHVFVLVHTFFLGVQTHPAESFPLREHIILVCIDGVVEEFAFGVENHWAFVVQRI